MATAILLPRAAGRLFSVRPAAIGSSSRLFRPLHTSLPRRDAAAASGSSSSSSSSSNSGGDSNSGTTKDPSHPYLYYHPIPHPQPGRVALSFLPSPPKSSETVLGWLPLIENATLEDFRENPGFLDTLHEAIRSGLEGNKAPSIEYEAAGRPGDGYMHITDERAVPPAGRIGETEDLIGSVFVQEGKVVPSTYTPLPTYRLVTSNGPIILPQGLAEHVIQVLEEIERKA